MEDLTRIKDSELTKMCANLDEIQLRVALRQIDSPENLENEFIGKTVKYFYEKLCGTFDLFSMTRSVEKAILREAAIRWTECMKIGQS